jgi:hypothetical protein
MKYSSSISTAHKSVAFGSVQFRLWLLLFALSLSSCSGYGRVEGLRDTTTMMLIYGGQLSPGARGAVFASDNGIVGVWDDTSLKLRCRSLPKMTDERPFWWPDSRQFVVRAYGPGQGDMRRLEFVNVNDLAVEKRVTVPFHTREFCSFGEGIVGSCGWDEPSPFTLFRIEGDRLVTIRTVTHPAGAYNVVMATCMTNKFGLLLVHVLSDASRNFRSPVKPKDTVEACVIDARSGRIVQRAAAPAPPIAPWSRAQIALGGRHLLLCSADTIEIREFPSLKVSAQLGIKGLSTVANGPTFSIALSHDAHYVAFGSDSLELWDTRKMRVRTLDAMNSQLLRRRRDLFFPYQSRPPGCLFGDIYAELQYCLADIKFFEDGSKLAVLTRDGIYTVWNAENGDCLRRDHVAKVVYIARDAWKLWHPSLWCFWCFVSYSAVAILWRILWYRRATSGLKPRRRTLYLLLMSCGIEVSLLVLAFLLRGQTWIWQPSHAYVFEFPVYTVIAVSGWIVWYRRSLMKAQVSIRSVFVLLTLLAIGLSILLPAFG